MQKLRFKNFGLWIRFAAPFGCAIFHFSFFIFNLIGCAPKVYTPPAKKIERTDGVYHRVERGETLWRIAKVYNVELNELIRANSISDPKNIEIGELVLIPKAQRKVKISKGTNLSYEFEGFIWPIKGEVISSYAKKVGERVNKGIDIQVKKGDGVCASRSGQVSFVGELKGYGKTIIIDHGDGLSTVYAYNLENLVILGEWVVRGALVAKAGGKTIQNVGCLHFEIRKGHRPENPFYYLP